MKGVDIFWGLSYIDRFYNVRAYVLIDRSMTKPITLSRTVSQKKGERKKKQLCYSVFVFMRDGVG